MSNPRYRLHWVTALIEFAKTIKEMFLPLIVLFVANGMNPSESTGRWYIDYLSFIIFSVISIIFIGIGLIKWKRFVYWFEDDELRIEYGLFVKKKRYIPFDRIQSLDYTEGILHRPFGLVKVKVETAGSSSPLKAEAELVAITKEAAAQIEREMAEAKKRKKAEQPGNDENFTAWVEEPATEQVYTMSPRDLLILATTSGGIGVILSGVAIFLSQFSDLIPYDRLYEEFSAFIKFGILIVGLTILLGFVLVWLLSVGVTFLSHYCFTVTKDEEDLVITRGLLEKKRMTVPLKRIQSVRVIENPFRKLFGYATVAIDSAGGSGTEGAKINLFPLIHRKGLLERLEILFPQYHFEEPNEKLPPRAKRFYYRIDFLWMLPVIGALTYFFFPHGLLAFLLIPIVMMFGIWQHRSAAFIIHGKQLTLRFRQFSLQTVYLQKRRIQSMEFKQNYFHKRRQVASVTANVKSGMGVFKAQVLHLDEADAERMLDWYEPGKEASFLPENVIVNE